MIILSLISNVEYRILISRNLICTYGVYTLPEIGYGVTANIAASHAAARGSIPRIRITFFLLGSTTIFPVALL
jgi:hypothetical protein